MGIIWLKIFLLYIYIMFQLCPPAMIYLGIGIVYFLMQLYNKNLQFSVADIAIAALLIFWTGILNFLCSKNYAVLSWVLVIIPSIGFLYNITTLARSNMTSTSTSTK